MEIQGLQSHAKVTFDLGISTTVEHLHVGVRISHWQPIPTGKIEVVSVSEEGLQLSSAVVAQYLRDMCGAPVRVSLLDPTSRERALRLVGVLLAVADDLVTVECLEPAPDVDFPVHATFELLGRGKLAWGQSMLRGVHGGNRACCYLAVPDRLQTQQRRRYPRIDLDLNIHVSPVSTQEVIAATLRDLSAGGAAIQISEPIPEGETVLLILSLGSGLFFQDLRADVIRCRKNVDGTYNAALKFRCRPDQEAAIAEWVEHQLAQFRTDPA